MESIGCWNLGGRSPSPLASPIVVEDETTWKDPQGGKDWERRGFYISPVATDQAAKTLQESNIRTLPGESNESYRSDSLAANLAGFYIEYGPSDPISAIHDMMALYLELPRIVANIFRILGSQECKETYLRCLQNDLERASIEVFTDPEVKLYYHNRRAVGHRKADMAIRCKSNEMAILQIKAAPDLSAADVEELQFYMNGFDIDRGYVINFPHDDGHPIAMTHEFNAQALLGKVDASVAQKRSFLPPHSPAFTSAQIVQLHRVALSSEEILQRKAMVLNDIAMKIKQSSTTEPDSCQKVKMEDDDRWVRTVPKHTEEQRPGPPKFVNVSLCPNGTYRNLRSGPTLAEFCR